MKPDNLSFRAYLRTVVRYNPKTGEFHWQPGCYPKVRARAWQLAGHVGSGGYIRIDIDRRSYLAHRLAWLLVCGEPIPQELDHIDGNPSNNRTDNLRPVTRSQNAMNTAGNRLRLSEYFTHLASFR